MCGENGMSKSMKSQEQVEKKYEELNESMAKNIEGKHDPTTSISLDAQRYALEWVLGHHD